MDWISEGLNNLLFIVEAFFTQNFPFAGIYFSHASAFVASNNSMKQLYTGRLAVGGTSTIKIINIQNYNIEMNITGHELWVNTVKVLDDGVIISGSTDKTVKLWNILEGNCIFTLKGNDATINDLIQVKSGEIICCLFNGSIKIWREKKESN